MDVKPMGSLKKFANWLSTSGTKRKKTETSPLTKIKIFNKRLARQVKKMEIQERSMRKKAIESRKQGDLNGSRMKMKSSLQYRKWSHATENFRVRMEGVQFKLQQAKAMEQFSSVATDIAKVMNGLQLSVKAPEIAKMMEQIDLGFGSMDSIMTETTEKLEQGEDLSTTGVTEDEVNDALAEVDATLSIETGQALPSAPMSKAEPEGEISDIEAEINKLKAQRGGN